ncbi:MAG: phosphate/phosphite/phosphonate ABC transporter substrate-binding protein [Deltaproteobacteria bacterium]|nr:MAG: phosphate/phosphite/phosphonate ABC transporter substrate-binding protein [Deltaproteobacteria bacterium]
MRASTGFRWMRALLGSAVFPFLILSSSAASSPASPAPQEPIRIGVSSMITPVDTVRYYQEIIDYIGARIQQPVRMVHRRTYKELDGLLERGEIKIAFICSAPYVKDRERFGVELLVAPSVNGSTRYQSYIIVHNDRAIKTFPELKGKSFAFTDPNSNSGKIYPTYLLKTMGYVPEKYFGRTVYSYSHNKSVEMVAKKVVDGAAVDSIVYEYMRKTGSPYARRTKVIKRSPPYGIPPVVVTRDIDHRLKNKVKEAFLSMRKTPRGKAILDEMMIDGFVEVPDSNYDTIREMERAVTGISTVSKKARSGKSVYFGIIPRDNPRITYEKYQPLLDYLSSETPFSYELVLKRNYEETVDAIATGETDLALLGPLTYLEARARCGAICILKPKGADGRGRYRSVIVKKRDNPLQDLSGLKGESVAFASSKSTSGNLLPRYLLAGAGIHLNDLRGYANYDFHDSVLKAVLKGQYAAGAVRDSVARKYMKLGIEVISESGDIPMGPLVVGPGVPPSVTEAVMKALLKLNPSDPGGEKVLKRLDEDYRNGFTEASDGDYEGVRSLINAVPKTCGRGCHPKIRL